MNTLVRQRDMFRQLFEQRGNRGGEGGAAAGSPKAAAMAAANGTFAEVSTVGWLFVASCVGSAARDHRYTHDQCPRSVWLDADSEFSQG